MQSTTILSIILLASLSFVSTLSGVALAYWFRKSTNKIVVGIGFSTGIMLFISFFELVPASIKEAGFSRTGLALIFGALFIGILNFIIPHTHLVEEKDKRCGRLIQSAYLIASGLILHDFPEGFAMANSYIHEPSVGLLIALAIALHNIPEEFAMAVPLLLTRKYNLVFKSAFLSALAEPVGAVLGLFAVGFFPRLNSFFLAFAAGAMIFVSLHELFPLAERYRKTGQFLAGMFLSLIVYIFLNVLLPS